MNLGGEVGESIIMLQDTEQGDAIHTFVSDRWPHITGLSAPKLGFLSQEKLRKTLRTHLGDVRIEDAPIPLAPPLTRATRETVCFSDSADT